jgi:hypothetical protein
MAKKPLERQTDINLEDLLRLKRSERPSEQFWNEFDRELHQRMLQTLVKKDPWYLQVMRGGTGRILQSAMVAAAAGVVAMVMVRPAFQPISAPNAVTAAQETVGDLVGHAVVSAPVEVAMAPLALDEVVGAVSVPDYNTDAISVSGTSKDVHYVRDFGMERIQVASYDASAYSADSAHAQTSFASSGVASLVY